MTIITQCVMFCRNDSELRLRGDREDFQQPVGPADIQRTVRRKLLQLHAAVAVRDMAVPPGNRLEALKGNRAGEHSVRVNDQWRICFRWQGSDAYNVEIVDYH